MTLVADTGPLIGLAKLDLLDALTHLVDEIVIPPTVHRELLARRGSEAAALDRSLEHVVRVSPAPPPVPAAEEALRSLDEGERQAIRLAATLGEGVLLLMDDRAGRGAAARLGVATTGLVGVLLRLMEQGHVERVTPLVEAAQERGYWLSDEVVEAARRLAGEAEPRSDDPGASA